MRAGRVRRRKERCRHQLVVTVQDQKVRNAKRPKLERRLYPSRQRVEPPEPHEARKVLIPHKITSSHDLTSTLASPRNHVASWHSLHCHSDTVNSAAAIRLIIKLPQPLFLFILHEVMYSRYSVLSIIVTLLLCFTPSTKAAGTISSTYMRLAPLVNVQHCAN